MGVVFALRRGLVARRPLRIGAGYAGIAAAGAGLYLALLGEIAAAAGAIAAGVALLWLSGMWVLPWGRDAYLRRVIDVTRAWHQNAQTAYDVSARRRAKLRGELKRLFPPSGFKPEHERLLALVADDDREASFAERVTRSVTVLEQLDQAAERLRGVAGTPAERRYVRSLDSLRDEGNASYSAAAAKAESASHEAAAKLTRMRPPAGARDEQERLAEAFREYLAAAQVFHDACLARDPRRAGGAASGLDSAQQELRGAYRALAERLDYAARWPAEG